MQLEGAYHPNEWLFKWTDAIVRFDWCCGRKVCLRRVISVLLVLTIDRIYLNPLLGEVIRCNNVIYVLPAPPRHIIKQRLRRQKHGCNVEVNGDLSASQRANNLKQHSCREAWKAPWCDQNLTRIRLPSLVAHGPTSWRQAMLDLDVKKYSVELNKWKWGKGG